MSKVSEYLSEPIGKPPSYNRHKVTSHLYPDGNLLVGGYIHILEMPKFIAWLRDVYGDEALGLEKG
jgi:hypothetical protein